MQLVRCVSIMHPNGHADCTLRQGAFYEVVSEHAGSPDDEFVVVRERGTRGPDMTRPWCLFKPVDASCADFDDAYYTAIAAAARILDSLQAMSREHYR